MQKYKKHIKQVNDRDTNDLVDYGNLIAERLQKIEDAQWKSFVEPKRKITK